MFDTQPRERSASSLSAALATEVLLPSHCASFVPFCQSLDPTTEKLLRDSLNYWTKWTFPCFAACHLFVFLVRATGNPIRRACFSHICGAFRLMTTWTSWTLLLEKGNEESIGVLFRSITSDCSVRFSRINFATGRKNQENLSARFVKSAMNAEDCVQCSILRSNKSSSEPLWAISVGKCSAKT